MTIRKDDRTTEEKKQLDWLVTGTDRFLSGWGQAEGGASKCAWACKFSDLDKVEKWVRDRSDMKYVNVTNRPWYPRNAKHVHIYAVKEGHPALG